MKKIAVALRFNFKDHRFPLLTLGINQEP